MKKTWIIILALVVVIAAAAVILLTGGPQKRTRDEIKKTGKLVIGMGATGAPGLTMATTVN